ncbi:MAG: TonB-dependent receptor [Bacteroidales bacterium]|jgi:hypothetical protein|nr:TonB-dependent receptor [Bacteroidales bacterium]
MKRYFTLFFIFIFSTNVVFSATFSTIKGTVKDAQTKEELIGASIWIKEQKTGTVTGLDGSFHLQLNQFPVTLVYSYIGYVSQEIIIENSKQTTLNILLMPNAQQLEGVVIRAESVRNTDIGARTIERNALNVMNVVSARSIEISPDMTVANVIQRMSGVVMERDNSGDGQYALLRGMDKRFNYTLVNGVKIPSPDNKNRFVPLDIFPSELLDRLEVTKALTADMEGDGIGGAINMVMKDAPSDLQVTANLSTSVNSQFFSRDFQTFNHSAIDRQSPDGKYGLGFPSDMSHFTTKNLRVTEKSSLPMGIAGGFSAGGRVFKDKLGIVVASSYSNAYRGNTSDVYGIVGSSGSQHITNRFFSTEQTRLGTHAKFDLRLNKNHKLMWYNAYMDFQNKQVRDAIGGSTQVRTSQTVRMRWNHQSILTSTLKGDHHFLNNKLCFNWSLAYGRAFNETPDNTTIRLNVMGDEVSAYATGVATRRWEENSDNDKAVYANLIYFTRIGAVNVEWSTGVVLRDKQRESLFYEYKFRPASSTPQLKGEDWNHFDEIKMDLETISLLDPLNYDASEKINASYIQSKITLSKLQMIAGLRMEHTRQGYDLRFPLGGDTKPIGFQEYYSWLPSFHTRYELDRNTNLRFSYVKAINRPSFFEIVPYMKEFEDYREVGNPELRHTVADNFDLRYEYFPRSSEQIMVGVFYKYIKDPIEYGMAETGRGANYMPDNLGNANNLGIEMDVTRYFRKFGVKANYTFTHSRIVQPKWLEIDNPNPYAEHSRIIIGKNQYRQLFGQAAHVANISLLYRDMENGWNGQIAFSYTSKRLVDISRWYNEDIWQDGFIRLDASIEKTFPKIRLTVFAKASNLLNTPMYLYLDPNNPKDERFDNYARRKGGRIERIEHYGVNILIGLKYKL